MSATGIIRAFADNDDLCHTFSPCTANQDIPATVAGVAVQLHLRRGSELRVSSAGFGEDLYLWSRTKHRWILNASY